MCRETSRILTLSEEMDDDGSRWDVYFLAAESQIDITSETLLLSGSKEGFTRIFFTIKGE